MSDLLGNASDWLEDQRHTHLTREVVYSRNAGGDPLTLQATVGRTEFERTDVRGGILEDSVARDYLIRAEDLTYGEPLDGDTITDGESVYTVASPGGGQPSWRWSDPNKKTYRIHTKESRE